MVPEELKVEGFSSIEPSLKPKQVTSVFTALAKMASGVLNIKEVS